MSNYNPPPYPDEENRTVLVPNPGRRRPPASSPPPTRTPEGSLSPLYANPPDSEAAATELITTGASPLIQSASSILLLTGHLRDSANHRDAGHLRSQVLAELKKFDAEAGQLGVDNQTLNTARYVLCALIDETVMNTVWGSQSGWSNQTLLSALYNETSAGEKFFVILDPLLRDNRSNVDLLELMFVCLSLGFKGKYRLMRNGQSALEELRYSVFDHIRSRREYQDSELSQHWQPIQDKRNRLQRFVPLWVLGAVAGVIMLSVFVGYSVLLEKTTNPVLDKIQQLSQQSVVTDKAL